MTGQEFPPSKQPPEPSSPDAGPRTRRFWTAALALGGLGAGVGVSWWRLSPGDAADGAEAAFWALDFEGPHGEVVSMARFKGRPLLLNFWATWCPPCVEELPLLNAFFQAREAQGWQVVGLAVDQPSAVRRFLEKMPLAFPVGMAGLSGSDLSRNLGNGPGALPFTVLFDPAGKAVQRKLGKVSAEDLQAWAQIIEKRG